MYEDEDDDGLQRYAPPKKRKVRKRPEPFSGNVEDLTPQEVAKFISRVRYTVMYHLQKGDKTRHELEQKLLKKVDIPSIYFGPVLDEYEEKNFINDERYASTFAHSRAEYRKQGKGVIQMELVRKGVAREIIDAALEDWDEDEAEDRARELVRRRLRATQKLERQKRVQSLVGMLARKGYPFGTAFSVVKEVLDEADLEAELEGFEAYEEYPEEESE